MTIRLHEAFGAHTCSGCGETTYRAAGVQVGDLAFALCDECRKRLAWQLKKYWRRHRGQ